MPKESTIFGSGSPETNLSAGELFAIVEQTLKDVSANARALAIILDKTRDDNTDLLFPFAAKVLETRGVSKFDALVAQGTHADD